MSNPKVQLNIYETKDRYLKEPVDCHTLHFFLVIPDIFFL